MDHNGAFTADENVDTLHRAEAGGSRVGEDAMLVAEEEIEAGSKTPSRISESERSRLLEITSIDGDGVRSIPTQGWTNSADWDHLPWHKRPSVRSSYPT